LIKLDKISFSYGKASILNNISLTAESGKCIVIAGPNGSGKSTFLQTITEKIPVLSGHFKLGYNVVFGYFAQLASKKDSTKTILQEFCDLFPKLDSRESRSALGAFLFSGNDVNKKLKDLSGGELVRFELCKIFQAKPSQFQDFRYYLQKLRPYILEEHFLSYKILFP
jgi:ATP-binding cassette subfamily F protein 3